MTTPRYTQLRAAAQVAEIRTARYEGVDHLVVPLVAMVAGRAIRPLGSEDWELVPAEALALAPSAWDSRSVVEDHPIVNGEPVSASRPEILERDAFGTVFNTRFEAGRLKMEAWINPERAVRAGRKAEGVVARLRALAAGETEELVEVSVGAFVVMEEAEGIDEVGQRYGFRWKVALPDHVAVGLNGAKGACSAEAGCGAPRFAKEEAMPTAVLRAAVLATARRPKFSGTESTAWSAPSWSDYVRYLHEGREGPGSVAQASAALKREVAAHSLLGDPDGSNLGDLAMFPVVNPANGNLNERALRAVLGGRGSQADIPDRARTSAQDMARRLLNSEFGAELEVAKMSDPKSEKSDGAARGAAESENVNTWLREALMEVERGFEYLWVESWDSEAGTVVYMLGYDSGPSETYQRSYELDETGGKATVGAERTAVRRRVSYEPAPVAAAARSALPAPLIAALRVLGFRFGQDEGTSDVALRERMDKVLRDTTLHYAGIAEVFPETRTVIYSTRPEESLMWWRRTYATFEESVTLNDDAIEVEIEQSWKPVQARLFEDPAEGVDTPCGCRKQGDGPAALTQAKEGDRIVSTTLKESVGRLIANAAAPFTDKDKERLEAMSEKDLAALEAAFKPAAEEGEEGGSPPEQPAKATEAEVPTKPDAAPEKVEGEKAEPKPEGVVVSKADYDRMLAATASLEALERQRKAEENARKGELVTALKAAQSEFTEEDLKALALPVLEKLARTHDLEPQVSGRVDYSGRALASARASNDHTPPDPYAAHLAAARAKLGYPAKSADGKEAN